jgi:hypothetical protein
MLPHAFEASSAQPKRRRNHRAIKELAQEPAPYPTLSLIPNDFTIEIGGSPSFESYVCRESRPPSGDRRSDRELGGTI